MLTGRKLDYDGLDRKLNIVLKELVRLDIKEPIDNTDNKRMIGEMMGHIGILKGIASNIYWDA